MREYSFTEARQCFAAILDEAKKEGVVCIKKRDGEAFFLKPAPPKKSPLDVKGVDLGLSSAEIVDVIRKGRERGYGSRSGPLLQGIFRFYRLTTRITADGSLSTTFNNTLGFLRLF